MALKNPGTEHAKTVGHVSRKAILAVDERIKDILARREVAVRRARVAARRLDKV
jgi:hypothetical protein